MKTGRLLWLTIWGVAGAAFAVDSPNTASAQLNNAAVQANGVDASFNLPNALPANNAAAAPSNRVANATRNNRANAAARNNAALTPVNNSARQNNAPPLPNNVLNNHQAPINLASPSNNAENTPSRSSQTFAAASAPTNTAAIQPQNAYANGASSQPPRSRQRAGERLRRPYSFDSETTAYEEQVANDIRSQLKKDLENYCLNYCNIMTIDVVAEEVFENSNADLGFEGSNTAATGLRKFKTVVVNADILVDSRFGSENISRINKLFEKLTTRYGKPISLTWSQVTFPETAATQKSEAQVRTEFASQVRTRVERLISEFCPEECKLTSLDVTVSRATMDDAERGSVQRYLFANDGRGALLVNGVQISLSIHSGISSVRRSQIVSLVRESLQPFGSVNMDVNSVAFPRAASELQKDRDEERRDPYNIEKVGALLKLFRENLVSKEVIKETTNNSSHSQDRERENRESSLQRETGTTVRERENQLKEGVERERNSQTMQNGESETTWAWISGIGALALAVITGLSLWLRRVLSGQQMRAIIDEGMMSGVAPHYATETEETTVTPTETSEGKTIRARLECDSLQQEIRQIFVSQPKVARDVFTRILHENGIDNTAKYVVIFGEIIIYELLSDSDLKADLNTLAEFVHSNAPTVDDSEKLELLRQLKLKLTAGKMRLLANKTLDAFDFLKAWSPRQLFELVLTENSQVQGIVLTQLPPEKRRAVFEMFNDERKTILLHELSRIDLAPREYLIGTAETLKTKARGNPLFDAENVRGSDVLLDLLAGAAYSQQHSLITRLDSNEPEAAWRVRSSLVSVDTLAGIHAGLLIEMFLELDPQDIGLFLAGTKKSVSNLILSRLPREVATNWADFMANAGNVDPTAYRAIEQKVVSKIRQLVSKGKVNLAEINERLYPRHGETPVASVDRATMVQDHGVSFPPPITAKPDRVA